MCGYVFNVHAIDTLQACRMRSMTAKKREREEKPLHGINKINDIQCNEQQSTNKLMN